ncbi:uncharacterized protein N7511_000959 [Penicillium nucicola]|uniref:uncharacterized protein n=1 Tax=Penicillium nucicola TaxID=1850975 RepID=UPI0025457B13|nr:uncharacterized protein N7511_000959 [Penicillium nucicola]KAJ5775948.1 hypothetical protein N7511_000959 [Penicillium nucicola]
MEIIQDLHTAVANACEASFDEAYRRMKSQVDAHTKAAQIKESQANQAQRQAKAKIQELWQKINALQVELREHELDPRDLELPGEYANLETEFDPKNIWGNSMEDDDTSDVQTSRKRIEAKYTALYTCLQTFIQTWSDLKSRILQHKKKLRRWDRQLEQEEFTIVLNAEPVTFRRVQSTAMDKFDKVQSPAIQSLATKRPREGGLDFPSKTPKSLSTRKPASSSEEAVKSDHNKKAGFNQPSQPASTQSSSPAPDVDRSDRSSNGAWDLPGVHSQLKGQGLPPAPPGEHSLPNPQRAEAHPVHPISIKKEIMSSSPVRPSTYNHELPPAGTQDLDEIGDTIRTPMKRKAYRDAYAGNTWDSNSSSKHARHSKQIPQDRETSQHSVLQPVDGNARTELDPKERHYSKHGKDLEKRAIPSLAEDGEDVASHTTPRPSKKNAGDRPGQRRLENLLEQSAPFRSPLSASKKAACMTTTTEDTAPQDDPKATIRSQTVPAIDPDDEPYRSRPLQCLGLEHFKINPARNQGLDFAYNAVVRKKDDRKCISGCTRPGCCGDRFRAMARLGGLPARSVAEQEEEDQNILQEYLGEDSQLLKTLKGQDRENVLVEARARALANQYGRHRHAHQRAQSPPGFWRTEMPDTQDEESDREAAKRLEREKVEERYREAMRPGGLWTWADE